MRFPFQNWIKQASEGLLEDIINLILLKFYDCRIYPRRIYPRPGRCGPEAILEPEAAELWKRMRASFRGSCGLPMAWLIDCSG